MDKLTIDQILEVTKGKIYFKEALQTRAFAHYEIDSRTIKEGDVYVAIVGKRVDGHDYIKSAFDKGAKLALSEDASKLVEGCPTVVVENTIEAIGKLALYFRSFFRIPFIAVTGSVGKTSTKEMIASILSTRYKVFKTSKNYNGDIGMPLTILDLDSSYEVAVIEIGMDHYGEINYLSNILKPDCGVITNIGYSHIEFLGSREGILKAKTEMLPHISEDGNIILNGDDALLMSVKDKYGRKVLTYGYSEGCDCAVVNYKSTGTSQTMKVSTSKENYHIKVAYPGEHFLFNALAGILIGEIYDIPNTLILKGITSYKSAKMRLQQINVSGRIQIIDDAYNASIESMESALKTLVGMSTKGNRTVAILGSMFEMGEYTALAHKKVGAFVKELKPDLLIAVGDEAKDIYEGAMDQGYDSERALYFTSRDDMNKALDHLIIEGDIVLLKASRGMALEVTRDYLIGKFEVL